MLESPYSPFRYLSYAHLAKDTLDCMFLSENLISLFANFSNIKSLCKMLPSPIKTIGFSECNLQFYKATSIVSAILSPI